MQKFRQVYLDHNTQAMPSYCDITNPSKTLRLEQIFILYSYTTQYYKVCECCVIST